MTEPKTPRTMDAEQEADLRLNAAAYRVPKRSALLAELDAERAISKSLAEALEAVKAELRYYPGGSNREGDALIDSANLQAETALSKYGGGQAVRQATTVTKLLALQRHNFDIGDFWMVVDECTVTITNQTLGQPVRGALTIPRRDFNKLIDFYNRPQKLNSKKTKGRA